MDPLSRSSGFITMYGLLSMVLGFFLGAASGLALLIGLILLIAGRPGSGLRRIGSALTAGSLLPVAVAAALIVAGDACSTRTVDEVALVAAPAAALAGLLVAILVTAAARRKTGAPARLPSRRGAE